ncbi:hypothetical protein YWIDRAFT_02341 [Streptomyces sp. SceaMP-e96]|uniref:hypothetical protein n=1 Tax=Streptomyces TaxID=1883 RepID=UPI000823E483|nr:MULTISPECIES: hypothetical protein [unclassified Streptomyces]SCK44505.1 hypothetical protein YWIDRAFT_02341 [Streptomyces sp. SceaMP-e96]
MIDSHGPLARIMERVPPPAEAVNGSGDWGAAERALGTPLPEDFKRITSELLHHEPELAPWFDAAVERDHI